LANAEGRGGYRKQRAEKSKCRRPDGLLKQSKEFFFLGFRFPGKVAQDFEFMLKKSVGLVFALSRKRKK
jgi:hypothetical protein